MSDYLNEEPPPFFNTWNRLYIAVLIVLIIVIALLYGFTEFFTEVH